MRGLRPSPVMLVASLLIALAGIVAWLQATGGANPPFDPTFYRLATLCGVNITLAVSLNMVNGFTGQFSLGHAAFLGIGMYSALFLADNYGPALYGALPGPAVARQAGVLLALFAVAGALSAFGGLLVGLPSLRLRGDYLAIVTLGFGEILRVSIQNVDALGASRGFYLTNTQVVPSGEALFFWVAALAVASVMVSRNLMLSGPGRAFLAVREDEIAAEAVGVDTYRTKVLAFVLSAVFAGFAGVLNGLVNAYVDPSIQSIGFLKSIEVVLMVVLGGLGSVSGAVVTAVVITLLPELLRPIEQYRMVGYSALLVLLMLLRPQGLFGTREISLSGLTRRRAGPTEPNPPTPADRALTR